MLSGSVLKVGCDVACSLLLVWVLFFLLLGLPEFWVNKAFLIGHCGRHLDSKVSIRTVYTIEPFWDSFYDDLKPFSRGLVGSSFETSYTERNSLQLDLHTPGRQSHSRKSA